MGRVLSPARAVFGGAGAASEGTSVVVDGAGVARGAVAVVGVMVADGRVVEDWTWVVDVPWLAVVVFPQADVTAPVNSTPIATALSARGVKRRPARGRSGRGALQAQHLIERDHITTGRGDRGRSSGCGHAWSWHSSRRDPQAGDASADQLARALPSTDSTAAAEGASPRPAACWRRDHAAAPDDATEAQMACRGVTWFGLTGGRPVTKAVIRRTEKRAPLYDAKRKHFGAPSPVAIYRGL